MERTKSLETELPRLNWQDLLDEALTIPGGMGNTYNRFYNYSFLNQMILYSQGVLEPVATYKRWLEMGRQVQKGSKAKAILRPISYKSRNEETGEDESKVKGFKMVTCLFGVSETDGDELPPYEPKEWSPQRALGTLAIREVAFEQLDGNMQGYSYDRNIAINPVAVYPLKTLLHEVGHVVLNHTTPEGLAEYQQHRGIKEFQAESTAYLSMHELEADEHMDAAESRHYIQTWLRDQKPSDQQVKEVFSATDKILKAGREV